MDAAEAFAGFAWNQRRTGASVQRPGSSGCYRSLCWQGGRLRRHSTASSGYGGRRSCRWQYRRAGWCAATASRQEISERGRGKAEPGRGKKGRGKKGRGKKGRGKKGRGKKGRQERQGQERQGQALPLHFSMAEDMIMMRI